MHRDSIIILINKDLDLMEAWGSLTEICKMHKEFSYNYLKKKKFPFEYKEWEFKKVPFRTLASKTDD